MEELPKIDLPEEWLIGTGVNKELLNLYTNFPCRLKSEIFVLCMDGEIEASVNLNRITVRANDFATIMPGSILQIHSVSGEPILYFGGFSSKYIEQANFNPFIYQYFIYNDRKTCHFIKTGRNQIISGILSILDKIIRLFQ